jgi:hypothetical protein
MSSNAVDNLRAADPTSPAAVDGSGRSAQTGLAVNAVERMPTYVAREALTAARAMCLRPFKIRLLVAGSLGEFLTTSLMLPMFFLDSLYMQEVLGYSPLKAGLAWAPGAVLFLLLAPRIQGAVQ